MCICHLSWLVLHSHFWQLEIVCLSKPLLSGLYNFLAWHCRCWDGCRWSFRQRKWLQNKQEKLPSALMSMRPLLLRFCPSENLALFPWPNMEVFLSCQKDAHLFTVWFELHVIKCCLVHHSSDFLKFSVSPNPAGDLQHGSCFFWDLLLLARIK